MEDSGRDLHALPSRDECSVRRARGDVGRASDDLKRELSQIVRGVEHTELTKKAKDGSITNVDAVVTFSTPSYAARAMAMLPSG